jgi:HAD superfamily hydrolase (TIGR01509 family)
MNQALIFDCDGVLADTEPQGHLPAFNQMWRELGVPWQWSVEQYGEKLKIGGGKERMVALFREPEFLKAFTPPEDDASRKELLATWHKRKSAIYRDIVNAGRLPPRPGVKRLCEAALAHGWKLAVASTSAQASVETVLRRAVGDGIFSRFDVILGGDVVANKKPAPDIYLLAAERLGVPPARCVVIEDSSNGLRSALAAGMTCVVTVSGYTREEDFSGASLMLTCLGDPGGETCRVLANRSPARPGDYFSIEDLQNVLAPS